MTKKEFKGKVVGQRVTKVDSLGLACGKPAYVEDMYFQELVHVKMLRSPHAHAIIKSIDTSKASALPGVLDILTYENTPQVPMTTAGQGFPEPSPYDTMLFNKKVKFVGEQVAAVAAINEKIAEKATTLIKVEYEVLEPIFDHRKSMDNPIIIHEEEYAHIPIPVFYDPKRNFVSHAEAVVGDVEKALKEAEVTVEHEITSHYGQHCPIEPHVSIAYLDEKDRIVIRTSTQVPFHARRIVAHALEIPLKRVRVIKPRIGGGFGTKQEVIMEPIVALFALRLRKAIKYRLNRSEELHASRTRHPMTVAVKLASSKDGKLSGIDLDVISNTGAYGTHGLTVMTNAGSKSLPLYPCDNVRFDGKTVYTNLPVSGAYRGYGGTQAAFGLETALDILAHKLQMDPVELRKINHIKPGQGSPIFEALGEGTEGVAQIIESCGLAECIDIGAKEIRWSDREKIKEQNSTEFVKRGFGMCTLLQGSSIPEIDMASASAKMNDDGSFNLLVGATDLGTGSDTILSQIFAEVLDIGIEDVIPYSSDTDLTPFDKGAYASSTTYLSGQAVEKCAGKIKEQLIDVFLEEWDVPREEVIVEDKKVIHPSKEERVMTFEEIGNRTLYQKNQKQIQAVASALSHKSPPPFAAHYIEIDVNILTGKIDVINYVAACDCGTAINPTLAEGQIEGAMMNGLTYSLTERFIFDSKGKMLNDSFDDYKLYTASDFATPRAILVPTYEPSGPMGAKSVAEVNINGALPTISNALFDALGIRINESPYTPEKILKALKEK